MAADRCPDGHPWDPSAGPCPACRAVTPVATTAVLTAGPPGGQLALARRIDDVCVRFEAAWRAAGDDPDARPALEAFLADVPDAHRPALAAELLPIEVFHRRRLGEDPDPADYAARLPTLDAGTVRAAFAAPTADGDAGLTAAGPAAGPPPDAPRPDLPGYAILADLGDGGMGRVYKARQVRLDRVVAVKVIRPDRVSHPAAVRRFQREARAVAKLDHPHIVRVFDANEANGVHFLVMEYLPGADLGRVAADRGPLPVAEACDYGRQAALGLQHAHERGLVHRDVKPANLFLTADGVVKVLDLGLARLRAPGAADDDPPAEPPPDVPPDTTTRDGVVMGTPDFLAPEQAANTAAADIRADLYSLGCTLFTLLTGRVVFPGGDVADKARRHAAEPPPSLVALRPDVPPRLAAVVAKLLAKDPAGRYQTPAEAAAALEPFARPTARRRWRVAAAAGLLAVAAGAVVFARPGKEPVEQDPGSPPVAHPGRPEPAPPTRGEEARAALARGKREFAARNTKAAVAALEEAVAIDPGYWEAFVELGRTQVQLGRPGEGLAALDRAAALRPADWQPYFYRGVAHSDLRKDFARAAAEYTGAIDRGCPGAAVWLSRGQCYQQLKDPARALADFDEAIRREPDLLPARLARGLAHESRGQFGAALADLDWVVALAQKSDQKSPVGYEARGRVRYKFGDPARAAADWGEWVRQVPNSADAHKHRASARLLLGDWPGGAADWFRAVDLGWTGKFDPVPERSFVGVLTSAARNEPELFRAACKALHGRYAQTKDPRTAYLIARLLAQTPDSGVAGREAVRLAELAAKANPTYGWCQHTAALAHLRARNPAEALRRARLSLDPKTEYGDGERVLNLYVIVLAELALGNRPAAVVAYWKAEASRPVIWHPHDAAGYVLLKREAAQALGLAPPLAPMPRVVRRKAP